LLRQRAHVVRKRLGLGHRQLLERGLDERLHLVVGLPVGLVDRWWRRPRWRCDLLRHGGLLRLLLLLLLALALALRDERTEGRLRVGLAQLVELA
jgi:hypothetical protein